MNNQNKSLVVLTSRMRSFLSPSLCLRFPVSALFISVLLLSSIVIIPGRMAIGIAQRSETASQEATRDAANRLFDEGLELYKQGTAESRLQAIAKWEEVLTRQQQRRGLFSPVEVAVMPTSANFGQYPIKMAQSRATKPQNTNRPPSEAEAKVKPLLEKVKQLSKEAQELRAQPNSVSQRQAIAKQEELVKIWRLPELRAVFPKESRFFEASSLSFISAVYASLSENPKAVEYGKQALAIFRELKDPRNRELEAITLYQIALPYLYTGEKQKALDALEQARSLYSAENKTEEVVLTWSATATIYVISGEFKKSLAPFNKALEIQEANNLPGKTETIKQLAGSYSLLGNRNKALEYYRRALENNRQTNDLFEQVDTLRSIGSFYSQQGERQQAEKYYQEALQLQKALEKQLQKTVPPGVVPDKNSQLSAQERLARYRHFQQQMIIFQDIATSYYVLGDSEQQLAYLNKWQTLAHQFGNTQQEADAIISISKVYSELGDKKKAKGLLDQALKMQRSINYLQGEAEILNQQAEIYLTSGEPQEALKLYNQALNIYQRLLQNPLQEAQTLSNIAGLYNNLGDYDSSINRYYKEALEIYKCLENPVLISGTLGNIGDTYTKRGRTANAPEDDKNADYLKALDYNRQAREINQKEGIVGVDIASLLNVARTYEFLKKYPEAIAAAEEALKLSHQYELKYWQRSSLIVLGRVYTAAGDYQKALDFSKQSFLLSQKVDDLSQQATTLQIQGKIYTSIKQPQQALATYNQELTLRQKMQDKPGEAFALYNLAVTERDTGKLQQALTQIKKTIKIVEGIRSKVISQDLRSSYFATVQDYYKFYIDLLMQLHKKDPSKGYNAQALHTSERARARNLLELLAEANVDIRQGVDPKLVAQERSLQQQLNAAEFQRVKLAQGQYTNKQLDNIKQLIESLDSQLDDVQAQIRVKSPEYATLTQGKKFDKLVLTLPQIQQQVLDDNTLLLEYSLGEERSFLWVVSKTGINSYELPKGADIKAAALAFNKELLDKKDSAGIPEVGIKLSQMILAPVASQLKQKRLLIVGDGALQTIPFTVLPIPQGNQNSAVNTKANSPTPLLVQNEILTLPSASSIGVLRNKFKQRKKLPPKTIAVFADPVFSSDDERLTKIPQPRNDQSRERSGLDIQIDECLNLNRLNYTEKEANYILSLEPNSTKKFSALGFAASLTTAVKPDLSQYQIVHFATHGCVSQKNPQLTKLVLSQFDEKRQTIDGNLNLNKIYNLNLPVELVTLSACKTGLGKNVQGEGLVGLTRGFMYAGAKRVVVSLWSVNDLSTATLMQNFYQKMLKGKQNPVAAMRAAQLDMWKSGKAPYYWAAFTVQGEWQ